MLFMSIYNMYFMESTANIVLTIVQVLVVLYFLLSNKLDNAVLWHIVFSLTGFDATAGTTELQLYSYPEIKLVGPITFSYVILGLIWLRSYKIKILDQTRNTLIFKLRNILRFFLIYGTFIGLVGLMIFSYRFSDFILPFIYSFTGFLYLDIFIRLYNHKTLAKFYDYALCLIISSPIATFVSYFGLNIRATYSAFDTLIFTESYILASVLLLILVYEHKHKLLTLISLVAFFLTLFEGGRGGHFVILFFAIFVLLYLIYFEKNIQKNRISSVLRIVIPIFVVIGFSYFGIMLSRNNIATIKLMEALSLFSVFYTSGDLYSRLSLIPASPYIRIVQVFNILYDGLSNPFGLIFGNGFGGYYTDSTGLFKYTDVTMGGFSFEVASSGRYGYAHSAIPSVLLFNGIIGLLALIKLGIAYIKQIKNTSLAFVVIPFVLLSFYFNTSLYLAYVFTLFAAEYRFKY